jgi:hypothetical protein
MQASAKSERIELLRGGSVVSSLAGAFGSALRETRLTAMLGYVVAHHPERFRESFGFLGRPLSVSVERFDGADRSDICIETTERGCIIEAKVGATDPHRQSLKYSAKRRVLLTEHMASGKQTQLPGVKYLRWRDLVGPLQYLAKKGDAHARFVSGDLLRYLEEHGMIKTNKQVEIYAREINTETTLELFLKAQMYGCEYQQGSRLAEALYFAPHFGKHIARNYPGVQAGISYIARIERVEVGETWNDLLLAVREIRSRAWFNDQKALLQQLRRDWSWDHKRNFLFLSIPRLVFNPPVLKKNLQVGSGFLSKRSYSFDELFEARGCSRGENK